MDPLAIVLTVVAAILSIILIVVGVQTILVLQEVRRSLQHFNHLTEVIENTVERTFTPLQQMGGMVSGLKAGFKMLDTFATFLQKKHESSEK